ncbi:MAG: energy-coupling factor transporter transmembrane protein EcfT [Anaerolineales bacterium]|nr:energy-coupling factor transporter transmembrane protein EcfT [Anaerolineales bacterium]
MRRPTLFLPRASGLHALHPLTKLIGSGLFLLLALFFPEYWQVILLFFAGLLPLAVIGKVAKPFLRTTTGLILPFGISLFLIQGFFAPGENLLWSIGPLSLKAEGVMLAVRFTTRLLVWLGTTTLLMLITRPDHMMQALMERGLPRQVAYIVLTSLQIIPRFQQQAQIILDAQRSRGLETEGGLFHRVRMLVPLVTPLILGSILELEERAIALEARAFSRAGARTTFTQLEDSVTQRKLRYALLAGLVITAVAWVATRLAR